MTRHQRCETAIAGEPVDRAPAYIPAIACSVASELLGRTVHTGTPSLHYAEVRAWAQGEQAHAEFETKLTEDLLDVHRMLDIDVYREPWRMNRRPAKQIDDVTFLFGDPDGDHEIWQYQPETTDFSMIRLVRATPAADPGQGLRDQVLAAEAVEQDSRGQRPSINAHLKLWRELGEEFFVIGGGGGISVGIGADDLMALALAPEWAARRCMLQARGGIALAEVWATAPCPRVLMGGGDLAGTSGPMYSPSAFAEVVLPAYRIMVQRMNALGLHYVFRSDGNLWPLVDMLFDDARCPGYGETDRDATMTLGALRRRYPALVVWGNVSSRFLAGATPAQVRDDAKRIIDESAGTGYFHGCSNAIIHGTPPASVEAMFNIR